MIKRYRYGNPFPTGATEQELPVCKEKQSVFTERDGKFTYALEKDDLVYGLGEAVRGINKRGWLYESCNEDDPIITEKRTSLYGAHNFFVVTGKRGSFGAFFDCADRVVFDVGYTDGDELAVTAEDFDLYIVEGESVQTIVREFRRLIGQSYIPPKWAFGFGQSRWGYKCEEDIRTVFEEYKKNGMPLDMIYLDIDYMERFKDFTIDKTRYPDLKKLSDDLKAEGVRLVPIIDAGVKVEKGYSVYEEGVQKGYFCKDAAGNPYVVGVWPGDSVFPDVLNEEAADWFAAHYRILLDCGIEGFWNDMNEPSIFYSKGRFNAALQTAADTIGKPITLKEFQEVTGAFSTLANNRADYAEFYHDTKEGLVPHIKVHNLFGSFLTRAAAEYFEKYDENKRYLLFSRSSCIGMHRYGGIWTGDNASWWSHILLNLKMLPSLNMCGFLFVGADLGGFGDNTTEDLLLRWLALGVFVPLMRNHSSLNTRGQECYLFKNKEAFRGLLSVRYALVPYLYSEFVKCARDGDMMFTPLAVEYPEDVRARVEDQLFVGESLMIAPVYEQNARGRYVYLPAPMLMIRMKSGTQYTQTQMAAGDHYIEVGLDEVVFFLREGRVLPLAKPAKNIASLDEENLVFLTNTQKPVDYELYVGSGEKGEDLKKAFQKVKVSAEGKLL